jgi:hypothetical protein
MAIALTPNWQTWSAATADGATARLLGEYDATRLRFNSLMRLGNILPGLEIALR